MQVESTCHSVGCAGFQTPQLTVFGKVGKIGCQSALYLVESFRLEGTASVIGIDKLGLRVTGRSLVYRLDNVGARPEPWGKLFARLRHSF